MGKRKSQPRKADEAKRQLMTWNMTDQFQPIIDDSDIAEQSTSKEKTEPCMLQVKTSIVSEVEEHDELLENLIGHSDFYIPVYAGGKAKHEEWRCHLGTFQLYLSGFSGGMSPQHTLPQSDVLYIYVNKDTDDLLVYYEVVEPDENSTSTFMKKVTYYKAVSQSMTSTCFEAVNVKMFCLVLDDYSYETCCMNIKVYILASALVDLKYAAECFGRPRLVNVSLGRVMGHWYGLKNPDYSDRKYNRKHCIEEVLSAVRKLHEQDPAAPHVNIQHPSLKPTLRAYQKRAVAWMLYKERYGQHQNDSEEKLHLLYTEVKAQDGQVLFYNKCGGYLTTTKPLFKQSPPGGILADEMGLGKTVEVLALILLHPRHGDMRPSPLPVIEPLVEEERPKKGRRKQSIRKSTNERTMKPLNIQSDSQPSTSYNGQTITPTTETDQVDGSNIRVDISVDHSYSEETAVENEQTNAINEKEQNDSASTNVTHSSGDRLDKSLKTNSQTTSSDKTTKIDQSLHRGDSVDAGQVITSETSPSTDRSISQTTHSQSQVELSAEINSEDSRDEAADNTVTRSYWDVTARKQTFECICGENEDLSSCQIKVSIIQCEKCMLWQHAKCVNYNLTDPNRGRFLCPHCHVTNEPIPSGATLIVTPQTISHQWVDEILKHIWSDSLSVFVYTGVHKQGFIQPQTLANQDLVITTYETLRKEIDYVDLPHSNCTSGRKLRNPKRYMAIPSPIVAVEWWRICLDEAQMVECTTTKTAAMALRLSSINKWCVTGTPIQRGLEDAYGLLLFLGVDPYWVRRWWNELLLKPFCYGDQEPLLRVLTDVLWRSAKLDVLEEINLPTQAEQVHWLKFSPVEQHFYLSQYRKCEQDATRQLRHYKDGNVMLNSLDRYSLSKLLQPLTSLRQACCHPQAVRGAFLPIQKSAMTMDEVLQQLIKKTRTECEEAHRQRVAANNGLAALCIIRKEYAEAVEIYREILRSVVEHGDKVRTDDLQHLHTLHNLNEVLQRQPHGVSPTLRDSELVKEADEIRVKYKKKAALLVTGALEAWIPAQQHVRELQVKLRPGALWWVEIIQYNIKLDRDDYLVDSMKQALHDNSMPNHNSMVRKFTNGRGLMLTLHQALDALQSLHENLTATIHRLQNLPTDHKLVTETVECCLRPVGAPLATCVFCKAEKLFEEYEGKLYCFSDKGVLDAPDTEDINALGGAVTFHTTRKGTWADSETEKCLKAIITFTKNWGSTNREYLEFGQTHLKLFDALKKEFKCLRSMWMLLKEQAQSVDELGMAVTRVRLRMRAEEPRDPPEPGIIEEGQIDLRRTVYQTDKVMAKHELNKKLGHLMYLKNLTETQACLETGRNPDPCPVCQNELGTGWAVLRCGHCYCLKCIEIMIKLYSFGPSVQGQQMKCPSCRQKTRHADIAYVMTKKSRESHQDSVDVKGDHSTKVEGVVRCLLQIQRDDPEAKSLVFTTYVLGVLERALTENNIPCRSLTSYKFQENLTSFKQDPDVKVLLLPVHSGANGLNLIEATHVLLVEPVLNPAQELQAIGRVHRIGQTRRTFVHRFIVRNTIEERINGLLQTAETTADSHNPDETTFTIADFKALFVEEHHTISDDEGDDETTTTAPSQALANDANSADDLTNDPRPSTSGDTPI